jgi:hypothetical protein
VPSEGVRYLFENVGMRRFPFGCPVASAKAACPSFLRDATPEVSGLIPPLRTALRLWVPPTLRQAPNLLPASPRRSPAGDARGGSGSPFDLFANCGLRNERGRKRRTKVREYECTRGRKCHANAEHPERTRIRNAESFRLPNADASTGPSAPLLLLALGQPRFLVILRPGRLAPSHLRSRAGQYHGGSARDRMK